MAKISLHKDFQEFLKLLNDHNVRYLLIGDYAVAYHGYPRATADMDIWIARDQQNAKKLLHVFRKFGFDLPEVNEDLFLQNDKILRLGEPPIRIEWLTRLSGIEFETCYSSRIKSEIENIRIDIIDLESLKQNKKASGRYKDFDDLENLPQEPV